jgi:hypothetical protein
MPANQAPVGMLAFDSRATSVDCRFWVFGSDRLVVFAPQATGRKTWRGRSLFSAEELREMDESPFGPPEPEWGRLWDEAP